MTDIETLRREVSIAADKKYAESELLQGPRTVNNPSGLLYIGIKFTIDQLAESYILVPKESVPEGLGDALQFGNSQAWFDKYRRSSDDVIHEAADLLVQDGD